MAFAKYMEEIRVFLTEKGLITLFALHVVFEHEKCLTCFENNRIILLVCLLVASD